MFLGEKRSPRARLKSIRTIHTYIHIYIEHIPDFALSTPNTVSLATLARQLLKAARTPPTQFLVDGCYARLLLFVYLQGLLHYNTRTKYLPKEEPLTNFRANLEEISGPGYKTLGHFFGAVR